MFSGPYGSISAVPLMDCPCSFDSLGVGAQNFPGGGGQLWGAPSIHCQLSLCLVFVLLVWGGGSAGEMLSRSTHCD